MGSSEEKIYRGAWRTYLLCNNDTERRRMQQLMDWVQPGIAPNTEDPRWLKFTSTLPGYKEHWEGLQQKLEEMSNDKFGSRDKSTGN